MKKLLLCVLISVDLVGCSTAIEKQEYIGEPYLSSNLSKTEIGKPKVRFEHDSIIITPYIYSYFTKYWDVIISGSTFDDYIHKAIMSDVRRNIGYDSRGLIVTVKSDNSEITLPLSKGNKIHTSLEELNNPDKFTVFLSYKGETEEYDFFVPKANQAIQQSLTSDGFSISNRLDQVDSWSNVPVSDKLSEKATFKKINSLFDQYIERYVATIQKPTIPELIAFPEITQPKLPASPVLDKSQFETKAEFQQRVQIALDKRNKTIEIIQAEYRQTVEKRNDELASYLTKREKEISELVDGYNNRKEEQSKNINIAKVKQTAYAFIEVLGSPYLDKINYDAESQVLYGTIKMTKSKYQEKVSIQVSSEDAKYIFENKEQVPVSLSYLVINDEVKLNKVSVYKEDTQYLAKVSDTEYKADEMRVVINTDKKLSKAEHLQTTDIAQAKASSLQNPSLTDEYSISAVTFVKNKELEVGKAAFNDDIPTLLKNTKQRTVSKKRWLFVVGIEDYQQTDNIQYSRRSAELFIQVAQKKLGIYKRNTYSLIDEQATVGQIKDKMKLMLKNVKKGDDIYFYYNGHGIPDPQDNNEPYLLASDKIPDFVTDDAYFKLENFYQQFTNSKADKVVAFVDSCFSGATDGVAIIKGVAASRLAPKKVSFDQSKMVVMSAGTKKQYSNVYTDKGNRLFSYFVMKELLNDERQVSAIYKDVRRNVRETSLDMGDLKLQEPSLSGNQSLSI